MIIPMAPFTVLAKQKRIVKQPDIKYGYSSKEILFENV